MKRLSVCIAALAAGCGNGGAGPGEACAEDGDCRGELVCTQDVCAPIPADDEPPEVIAGQIDPPLAGPGDTVLATFTTSEPVGSTPAVELSFDQDVRAFAHVSTDGESFVFEYAVSGDEVEEAWSVRVHLIDAAGNEASIALGTVTFDFTAPAVLSTNVSGAGRLSAGRTGTFGVVTTEDLGVDPTATFLDGTPLQFVNTPFLAFNFSYTPDGSEAEGQTRVEVMLEDQAGNTHTAGPFDAFVFDFTPPELDGAPVVDPTTVGVDDVVTVTFTTTEEADGIEVELIPTAGGAALELLEGDVSGLTYTYERTIRAADPAGDYDVTLTFTDIAGNDGPSPTLGPVTITP